MAQTHTGHVPCWTLRLRCGACELQCVVRGSGQDGWQGISKKFPNDRGDQRTTGHDTHGHGRHLLLRFKREQECGADDERKERGRQRHTQDNKNNSEGQCVAMAVRIRRHSATADATDSGRQRHRSERDISRARRSGQEDACVDTCCRQDIPKHVAGEHKIDQQKQKDQSDCQGVWHKRSAGQ